MVDVSTEHVYYSLSNYHSISNKMISGHMKLLNIQVDEKLNMKLDDE